MALPLAPPICDHCGGRMLHRGDRACSSCASEAAPLHKNADTLFSPAAYKEAVKHAIVYWDIRRFTPYDITIGERNEAQRQYELSLSMYHELTGARYV